MIPISSTDNSTALSLLVKVSDLTPAGRQQSGNAADNVLKTANGVSGAPSQDLKSASSAAGKFSVAQASTTDDTSSSDNGGKVIIGDLGTFDTFGEARDYVTNNDTFSAAEKAKWLATVDQGQRNADAIKEFKNSDLWKKISSGQLQAEIDALKAASGSPSGADTLASMKNFQIAQGQ